MFKLFTRIALISALLLLATTGAVFGQPGIPSATIALSVEGLVTPEMIPAGWVEVTFENTAETPLFGIMARLDDDATMEDFMGALMGIMGGDAGIVPPATFIGAPAAMPGTTQSVIYNLAAGSYILLNVAGEEPQIATFLVAGEAVDSEFEPEADLRVALVDFAFGLPVELPAGEQTWLIENLGAQWHELIVIPVPNGTTLEDAMLLLMAVEEGAEGEGGMPEFAAVWSPMSAGEKAWVTVDLAPGTYLVSCFIPDVNSDEHAIHAALGMIQIITVTDTLTYTDPAGFFTVNYPATLDAYSELFEGFPFPNAAFSSSPEVNETSMVAQPLPEGGWGVGLILLPKAMFAEVGMDEATPITDIAQAFVMMQLAEGDENVSDEMIAQMMSMMEVESIALPDGTSAAQVNLPAPTEDNLVLFFEPADGVIVLLSLLTAPGARTDEQVAQWLAMADSIAFTATVEELLVGIGEQ